MTDGPADDRWRFILYVAGNEPSMARAEVGLRHLCRRLLPDGYHIEVVDVGRTPERLPPEVLALPTAVRTHPGPERRVVGDLSRGDDAADGLGFHEVDRGPQPPARVSS